MWVAGKERGGGVNEERDGRDVPGLLRERRAASRSDLNYFGRMIDVRIIRAPAIQSNDK